jgi:hypothetical protein
MDDDSIDIELRPPEEIAARSIILTALARRLLIESLAAAAGDAAELQGEAFDLREWLRAEGVWPSLTAAEAALLERPVGDLAEDDLAAVACQAAGLVALGWALHLVDTLPPGAIGDLAAVVDAVPGPWDKTAEWMRRRELRSEAEIARERERAELYAWRVGVEAPRRAAPAHERADYAAAIADVVREARTAGLPEGIRDDDFTIGDNALGSFATEDLERLSALADGRLQAFNWLCGFGEDWDRVPLEI